jgi:hypothetical protein
MARLDRSPIGRLIVTDSIETQPVELSQGGGRLGCAALRGGDRPDPPPREHQRPLPGVGLGPGRQAVITRVAVIKRRAYV